MSVLVLSVEYSSVVPIVVVIVVGIAGIGWLLNELLYVGTVRR